VTEAGHRKELGDSLEEAEDDRLEIAQHGLTGPSLTMYPPRSLATCQWLFKVRLAYCAVRAGRQAGGREWLRFAENTPVGPSPPASPDLCTLTRSELSVRILAYSTRC
jgi:hypothetical protein